MNHNEITKGFQKEHEEVNRARLKEFERLYLRTRKFCRDAAIFVYWHSLSLDAVAQLVREPQNQCCAPSIEKKPTKAEILDRHDWEPWQLGHRITKEDCKSGWVYVAGS